MRYFGKCLFMNDFHSVSNEMSKNVSCRYCSALSSSINTCLPICVCYFRCKANENGIQYNRKENIFLIMGWSGRSVELLEKGIWNIFFSVSLTRSKSFIFCPNKVFVKSIEYYSVAGGFKQSMPWTPWNNFQKHYSNDYVL